MSTFRMSTLRIVPACLTSHFSHDPLDCSCHAHKPKGCIRMASIGVGCAHHVMSHTRQVRRSMPRWWSRSRAWRWTMS